MWLSHDFIKFLLGLWTCSSSTDGAEHKYLITIIEDMGIIKIMFAIYGKIHSTPNPKLLGQFLKRQRILELKNCFPFFSFRKVIRKDTEKLNIEFDHKYLKTNQEYDFYKDYWRSNPERKVFSASFQWPPFLFKKAD